MVKKEQTKECRKCHEVKPLSEFYKDMKSNDNKAYWCRTCMSEYRKERYNASEETKKVLKFVGKFVFPSATTISMKKEELIVEYKEEANLMQDLPKIMTENEVKISQHNNNFQIKVAME